MTEEAYHCIGAMRWRLFGRIYGSFSQRVAGMSREISPKDLRTTEKKLDVYCRVLASVGSTAKMLLPLLFYRNISLLLIHLKTAPFTGLAIRRSETLIQEGWKGK